MKTVLRVLVPLIILGLGVTLMQALIASRVEVQPEEKLIPVPLVETIVAWTDPIQLEVTTQGVVTPRTESRLVAEVSGRVLEVAGSWVDGGFFDQGDVLLRLDPTDYRLALDQAQVGVAQAEVRLAQEEADSDINLREWRSERGDAPPPALAVRLPQVAEARASLAAAKSMLEKARRDVERCTLLAPYAGRIRRAQVDVGEYVIGGAELGRVYAVDYAEVRLPLPDSELAFVDVPLSYRNDPLEYAGPEVRLTARFAGETFTWNGRIVRTEGELDPESRMVVTVARVEDPYGRSDDTDRPPLSVGLFVQGTLAGKVLPEALSIPRRALRTGERVYVLDDDDRLRVRPVEILRKERERVLLAGGVRPGERVIVSPLEEAIDGMQLRTLEPTDLGGER